MRKDFQSRVAQNNGIEKVTLLNDNRMQQECFSKDNFIICRKNLKFMSSIL